MEKLKGSTALIVLGIALLAFGAVYPFVTLVVDTTPPEVASSVPENGGTYASLNRVSVYTRDLESGIQSASFTVTIGNTGVQYALTYDPNVVNGNWQYWYANVTPTDFSPGQYSFSFTIINNAGLKTTFSGVFTIYTQLQGNWYINNQQITSSSQTIYSTSTSVSFKFRVSSWANCGE